MGSDQCYEGLLDSPLAESPLEQWQRRQLSINSYASKLRAIGPMTPSRAPGTPSKERIRCRWKRPLANFNGKKGFQVATCDYCRVGLLCLSYSTTVADIRRPATRTADSGHESWKGGFPGGGAPRDGSGRASYAQMMLNLARGTTAHWIT